MVNSFCKLEVRCNIYLVIANIFRICDNNNLFYLVANTPSTKTTTIRNERYEGMHTNI